MRLVTVALALGLVLMGASSLVGCGGDDDDDDSGGAGTGGQGSGTGGAATGGVGTGTGGDGTGTGGVGTGTGGGGGDTCTPPSTADYTYAGSCLQTDLCSDQYDTTFGAALLEQACTTQGGTWVTTLCDPSGWGMRCWQEVLGGLYVQYQAADAICALGCEEPL
jgi:hypothetical protein